MKVVIVYLIKGEMQKYQKRLIKKTANLSGERYLAYDNSLPEHITIKIPFRIKNFKKLENLLSEFASNQKRYPVKVRKFGNFRKFVAFLKTDFSRGAKKVQKNLVKTLYKEYRLSSQDHDINWNPHATLVYGNTPESFKIIWRYLKSLEKPKFDFEFDNITILKKPKRLWKVHKVFKIPK